MTDEKKALPDEALDEVTGGTMIRIVKKESGLILPGDLVVSETAGAPAFPIERCAPAAADEPSLSSGSESPAITG